MSKEKTPDSVQVEPVNLSIGDVVCLKGQSLKMTVLTNSSSSTYVKTGYFDVNNHFQMLEFNEKVLIRVEE